MRIEQIHPFAGEFFEIEELVPPQIFKAYGERSLWFLDPRAVRALVDLRFWLNAPIIVNDWHRGGRFKASGFRTPGMIGAKYSQHKFGRAFDIKVVGIPAKEIQERILENDLRIVRMGFTTMENPDATPTWTHLDCRFTGRLSLLIVNP